MFVNLNIERDNRMDLVPKTINVHHACNMSEISDEGEQLCSF